MLNNIGNLIPFKKSIFVYFSDGRPNLHEK